MFNDTGGISAVNPAAVQAFVDALAERFGDEAVTIASNQMAVAEGDALATWTAIHERLAR